MLTSPAPPLNRALEKGARRRKRTVGIEIEETKRAEC